MKDFETLASQLGRKPIDCWILAKLRLVVAWNVLFPIGICHVWTCFSLGARFFLNDLCTGLYRLQLQVVIKIYQSHVEMEFCLFRLDSLQTFAPSRRNLYQKLLQSAICQSPTFNDPKKAGRLMAMIFRSFWFSLEVGHF